VKGDNPAVCSGNGKCIDSNQCNCNYGFSGTNCEIKNSNFEICFGLMKNDSNVCRFDFIFN